jgi:carboxyl-terminal processing protease
MDLRFATLRACAAAWLLAAAGAALGASPPEPGDDSTIAALQEAYARAVVPGEQADLHRDLLAATLKRVKRSHVAAVDLAALAAIATRVLDAMPPASGEPAEVFKKAVNEALHGLDPYSRYIDARSRESERAGAGGSFGGVGLEVRSGDGAVRVVAPTPGGPAARAGLAPGDLIVRVDEQPLAGLALADAVARLRGQPGTAVSLTIQRAGADPFTVSLTRETVRRPLLRWSMEGEVLVLRLASFSGPASASIAQAVAQAAHQRQPAAVVLDLRGNPGGLLDEAVAVADAFLARGEIVSLRGGNPARQRSWQANEDELLAGVPMAVLIDGRSASASELVADALQANGRATVMGQRSFGKGSVQVTFGLGENRGAVKLTTSLYHGPSGQTVDHSGVNPDIELLGLATSEEKHDAVPLHATVARVEPTRCPAATAGDAALSCAVAYLRAGGLERFMAALRAD